VIWASADLNGPGGGPGRWRTHPHDEIVRFALDGETVKVQVIYPHGSAEPKQAYRLR
jgi:hypothetical protein